MKKIGVHILVALISVCSFMGVGSAHAVDIDLGGGFHCTDTLIFTVKNKATKFSVLKSSYDTKIKAASEKLNAANHAKQKDADKIATLTENLKALKTTVAQAKLCSLGKLKVPVAAIFPTLAATYSGNYAIHLGQLGDFPGTMVVTNTLNDTALSGTITFGSIIGQILDNAPLTYSTDVKNAAFPFRFKSDTTPLGIFDFSLNADGTIAITATIAPSAAGNGGALAFSAQFTQTSFVGTFTVSSPDSIDITGDFNLTRQ